MIFIETMLAELLTIGPEFFLLVGAPELPRRRLLLTVRQGSRALLVDG